MKQKTDSFQDRANEFLEEVIGEAESIGIPVSDNIRAKVEINIRAKNRLGACKQEKIKRKQGHFTIEIVSALNICEKRKIKEVLAHEILHTCDGCQNHGKKWKIYAEKMNVAYGYNIRRTYKSDEFKEVFKEQDYRYKIICEGCKNQVHRYRSSNLIKYTHRYRCNVCGGKLKVYELRKGEV